MKMYVCVGSGTRSTLCRHRIPLVSRGEVAERDRERNPHSVVKAKGDMGDYMCILVLI